MPENINNQGLCMSCRSSSTCTYRTNRQEPVLQCEEFNGYASAPVRTEAKKIAVSIEEKNVGKYKGLCTNCEIRETCKYPKPEGGVWHCEEYQ